MIGRGRTNLREVRNVGVRRKRKRVITVVEK